MPRDVRDDARDLPRIDVRTEVLVEPLEPLARHAGDYFVARGSGAHKNRRTGQCEG